MVVANNIKNYIGILEMSLNQNTNNIKFECAGYLLHLEIFVTETIIESFIVKKVKDLESKKYLDLKSSEKTTIETYLKRFTDFEFINIYAD